jgi:uncharacterized membrane protein YjjP (DUF1212 family)
MKKIAKKVLAKEFGSQRHEWWIVAVFCLLPWIFLGPVVFLSTLFVPFFFITLLGFILNFKVLAVLFLVSLLSLFVALHIFYYVVSVRRYQSLGKGAQWMLVLLLPLVGIVWQVLELGFVKEKRVKAE